MKIFVAPTEPTALRALGKTSLLPERKGVDVYFVITTPRVRTVGIQRKEYKDLLSSIHDGRIQRELAQMKVLSYPVLLIEGTPSFSPEGNYMGPNGYGYKWNRTQHHNFIHSVYASGVVVCQSLNLSDTITCIEGLIAWLQKPSHTSLLTRPKPKNSWGFTSNRDFALHLLQSFDGVGAVQAAAILDRYGKVPMQWEVGVDDLMDIPGIGPKTADKLVRALDHIKEDK